MGISGKSATWRSCCAAIAALCLSAAAPLPAAQAYTYSALGDPNRPVTAKPVSCSAVACTPSVVLMGGGYDVGEAFRWMLSQAGISPATGGRFLILRATGTDAYNPYVFSRLGQIDTTTPRNYEMVGGADLGLSSVETLIVPSRAAAEDPFVAATVSRANAIFIAGGDQADYYNFWQGTALTVALQKAVDAGIPVGGTSAGNAMLGQYAFAALNGTVSSGQALGDPFNKYMTIDPLSTSSKKFVQTGSFVSLAPLAKAITDDHVNTRDRIGRLFAFVARIGNACPGGVEAFPEVLGIGIDEETALLISGAAGNARAEMVANPYNADNTTSAYTPQNSAYFARFVGAPSACAPGKSLDDNGGIQVYRLSAQPSEPSPYPTAPSYSFKVRATFNLGNGASQTPRTYSDGSSLAGPYTFSTRNGTVLANPPY